MPGGRIILLCGLPLDEPVRRVETRDPHSVPLTRAHLESHLPFFSLADPAERALFDQPPRAG